MLADVAMNKLSHLFAVDPKSNTESNVGNTSVSTASKFALPPPATQLKLPNPLVERTYPAVPPVIVILPTAPKVTVPETDKPDAAEILPLALTLPALIAPFPPVRIIFPLRT